MRFGAILLLAMSGCAAPAPSSGGGIVSTNPCADAILVELVDPRRIAAISHYSQDAGATSIPLEVARRFRSTAGTAEEVIALNPALVITSSFTPLATRAAYARAGLNMLLLDSPTTIAASKAQVLQVATVVGEAARGQALMARIDSAVRSYTHSPAKAGAQLRAASGEAMPLIAAVPAAGPRPSPGSDKGGSPAALLFIGGNLANGSGTLLDELMTTAGFRNAAADYDLQFTGTLPIEAIAANPPDVILTPGPSRTAALRSRVLGKRVAEANFPRTLVNCGGPTIIPALARLAAIRQGVQ